MGNYLHNRFLLSKSLLLIEFLLLYFGIPLLIYFKLIIISKMTLLLFISIPALLILLGDPNFEKTRLFSIMCSSQFLTKLCIRFTISSLVITFFILLLLPQSIHTVQLKFSNWISNAYNYLILSVIPQEILYRAFFFHRYPLLFKKGYNPVLLSTLTFSFAHIVYVNGMAIIVTLIGGYFFSSTYNKSRSLLITIFEHFIYGIMIFSTGIGGILSGGR